MARLDNVKRIIKEDYDQKYHDIISKLSFTLNSFMEQVVNQVNGNLDFTNLKQEVIDYKVTVGASGVPTTGNQIRIGFPKASGVQAIAYANENGTNATLTGGVSVVFTNTSTNLIRIDQITGLVAGVVYNLRFLVIV